jgi:MFS family permease
MVCVVLASRLEIERGSKPELLKGLKFLVSNLAICLFFVVSFVQGLAFGVIGNFLFIHLESLGADELLMGLSITSTCVAEIPFFFFSKYLLKKMGTRGVLIFSLSVFVFRLCYYAFLTNPYYVLPCELLHGITFAASWAASIEYADSIAPPGMSATLQGLLTGIYWGLGSGCGALLGGVLYANFGGPVMFLSTAGGVFVALLIFLGAQLITRKAYTRVGQSEKELEAIEEKAAVEQREEQSEQSEERS